ncbi:MAG: hypothetical protein WCS52_03940 [bacterium]
MIHYQLNMAWGYVMPLELRRKWLHWVALYLLLMALAIALTLNQVFKRALYWKSQQTLVAAQEQKILVNHPGFRTIGDYEKMLGQEYSACVRDMEAILKFGQAQGRIASILISLIDPLPSGLSLGSVCYDGDSKKITFDVIMPLSLKQDAKITPPKLITLWEKQPLISKNLSQVEMENSERVRLGGQEAMSWRFSAVMGGP